MDTTHNLDMTIDKKIIYVDIDGTICSGGSIPHEQFSDIPEDYLSASPFPKRIEKINSLYNEGNTIVYWTARGCKSKQIKELYDLTLKQLTEWGALFHDLQVGNKPHFDQYICDKSYNADTWFDDEELKISTRMRDTMGREEYERIAIME